MDLHEKRIAEFHRLHSTRCFVMPNPWDAGTFSRFQRLPNVDALLGG